MRWSMYRSTVTPAVIGKVIVEPITEPTPLTMRKVQPRSAGAVEEAAEAVAAQGRGEDGERDRR